MTTPGEKEPHDSQPKHESTRAITPQTQEDQQKQQDLYEKTRGGTKHATPNLAPFFESPKKKHPTKSIDEKDPKGPRPSTPPE